MLQSKKEREIAKNTKANQKVFWKYVKSKTRKKVRIGDLSKDEDKTQKTNTDKEQADVLSEYFSTTFVTETTGTLSDIDRKEVPTRVPPTFTQDRIRQVITKFNRNKSLGSDEQHPRIIKEVMKHLLETLSIIYESSFREG